MPSSARIVLVSVVTGLLACAGSTPQDVFESASDSGTTTGNDGGTTIDSGTTDTGAPCPQETEPNDGKDTATALNPLRCGALTPSSDQDFLTFTLKPATKTLRIDFDGKVTLKVDVEGAQSVVLGSGNNPPVPFVQGKPYFVQVLAADKTNRVPWRVSLVEQ